MTHIMWLVPEQDEKPSIVWIDDTFFPPASYLGDADLPAMTSEYLNKLRETVLGISSIPIDRLPTHVQRVVAIWNFCTQRGFGFAVASFDVDEITIKKLDDKTTFFLLDVRNNFQSGIEGDIYGWLFFQRNGLPRERTRFFTRLGSQFADLRLKAYDQGLPLGGWKPTSGDTLDTDPDEIQYGLESWIDRVLLHPDTIIRDAIRVYAKPWEDGWNHKWHDEHSHNDPKYTQELSKWLTISVDLESSKALTIWRPEHEYWGTWYCGKKDVYEPLGKGYPVTGRVLLKFMEKLQVNAEGIIEDQQYYLPLSPAFPFLLSLRVFAANISRTPFVKWDRLKSTFGFVYRIAIRCEEQDWGLRNAFEFQGASGRLSKHCQTLRDLVYSRIVLTKEIRLVQEWRVLFEHGVTYRAVGISFTPGWVHLFWTAAS